MGLTLSHKPLNLPATLAVFTACRGHCTQPPMQIRSRGRARQHRYAAGDATGTQPEMRGLGRLRGQGMPTQVGTCGRILTQHSEMEMHVAH